jgi:hypothetical protein
VRVDKLQPIALVAAFAVATGGVAWAGTSHPRTTTCDTPAVPCIGGDNTAAGPGISGTSAGIGVEGTSAKTHPGVSATTVGAPALLGFSVSGNGAQGSSTASNGVFGTTSAAKAAAIIAKAQGKIPNKPAYAVSGTDPAGSGVVASGALAFNGLALATCPQDPYNIDCGFIPPHYPFRVNYLPIAALGVTGTGVAPPVVLRNAKGQIVFEVDDVGNVFFAGTLSCPKAALELTDTSKNPNVMYWVCQNNSQGYTPFARKYTPAEYDGQATLAGGEVRVGLDPDYAAGIDAAAHYRVFLTPLGDATGSLFVARQDAGGFVVRERGSQRAPLAFAYRIVATRAGGSTGSSTAASTDRDSPQATTPASIANGADFTSRSEAPDAIIPSVNPTPCAAATACVEGINTGAGAAVEGISRTGYGVVGSTTGLKAAGVEGIGVGAPGAFGSSTSSYGLSATSTTGIGVAGSTVAKTGAGVLGETAAAGGIGIEAVSTSGGGVFGSGAQSFSGTGPVRISGYGASVTNPTIPGPPLMIVRERADVFVVDYAGDPGYTGLWHCPSQYFLDLTPITGGATCLAQDPNSTPGKSRVERAGEARLTNGAAAIALDPAIARRLDPSQSYSVTLTPEGDSTGALYVASQSPSGFVVREHGGRSSIAFEYDLVAHVRDNSQ